MRTLLQDLRFSYREWRKRPGLALTAVLSLALGIGATTAVFSVIDALLVNPFPYHAADRMVHLVLLNERGEDWWPGSLVRSSNC
jgi:putative ABC transport system permease protein